MVNVPYLKEKYNNLRYNEGDFNYGMNYEQNFKEDIDLIPLLLNENYKNMPEFSRAKENVSAFFDKNEKEAEFLISRFVQVVIRDSVKGVSEERLVELTHLFIRDLEGSQKIWHPLIWLTGIWIVEEENIQIGQLTFRRPKEQDLEREYNLELFPPFIDNFPRNLPMAVLEYTLKAKGQPEVLYEIEKIIHLLRLFRVGSVEDIRIFWRSDSLIDFHGESIKSNIYYPSYKYPISKNDVSKFEEFQHIISPLLPIGLMKPETVEMDYSIIAIKRYEDALLKNEPNESKITYAIMSLEALYFKENEKEELQHRLSQRLAKIMKLCDFKPLEVYHTLRRAYDIRSSFVHGELIPKDSLKGTPDLVNKIIEYDRLSIILFLQLKQKMDKDKFLNLVDNSLLEEESSKKLSELIDKYCKF